MSARRRGGHPRPADELGGDERPALDLVEVGDRVEHAALDPPEEPDPEQAEDDGASATAAARAGGDTSRPISQPRKTATTIRPAVTVRIPPRTVYAIAPPRTTAIGIPDRSARAARLPRPAAR